MDFCVQSSTTLARKKAPIWDFVACFQSQEVFSSVGPRHGHFSTNMILILLRQNPQIKRLYVHASSLLLLVCPKKLSFLFRFGFSQFQSYLSGSLHWHSGNENILLFPQKHTAITKHRYIKAINLVQHELFIDISQILWFPCLYLLHVLSVFVK